jgi:predicted Zn-dependent protease
LRQTRSELAVSRWPASAVQDVIRRSTVFDLTAAVDHYHAALSLDPGNPVAHRRLGQIALSHGEYDQARAHLEAAHRASPAHHATRQMFGESLALTGDIAAAAGLWQTIPLVEDQLAIRAAWYESTGDDLRAGWIREAIARIPSRED